MPRLALKIVGFAFAGLIVLTGLGIGSFAVARVLPRTLPGPTGPSPVGRVELALRDDSRTDLAADDSARELAVWIWYPTAQTSGLKAAYRPGNWAAAANEEYGPSPLLFQDHGAVQTNAFANAKVDGRPSVVVLLPGLGMAIPDYSTLAEELASYGYAVVGINITGSSALVGFPDGRLVRGTKSGMLAEMLTLEETYRRSSELITVWAADAAFVVKTLAATPPVIGALDFSRPAYIGHSLGGAASFEICRDGRRCAATIDLDGTLWSDVRTAGPAVPALVLQSSALAICDELCALAATDFTRLKGTGSVRTFRLEGSRHMNFSDYSVLFAPLLYSAEQLGLIDGQRMVKITRDLVRTFLDAHVRGDGGLFTTVTTSYPELREE